MANGNRFEELGLSIVGLGAQYPPHSLKAREVEVLAEKFYPDTAAMRRVLAINRYTGIETRSSVGTAEHPIVNQAHAPSIAELHRVFMSHGVPLAVDAARKAVAEAGIDLSEITHVVSTTCTDSANPGFDHFVVKSLGITHAVERVLLHGVGCSGGLAVLRTAANLALGHSARRKAARILCIALEVSTTLARSELESIHASQETRIGVCLFSDCGSAVVLSNGIGRETAKPVYELLGWEHRIIPDTEGDLGFDVDPAGWKVILSSRVPKLATTALVPSFSDLLRAVPALPESCRDAADFDWAMHPGGATILTGAECVLKIKPEHMRASYDTYMNHGNSSSATIFSVMDRLRSKEMDAVASEGRARDFVVGCAFGPGVSVELCLLKRTVDGRGSHTPSETCSDASRSDAEDDGDWAGLDPKASLPDSPEPEAEAAQSLDGLIRPVDAEFVREALAGVELD